jgi:hypothetical protein
MRTYVTSLRPNTRYAHIGTEAWIACGYVLGSKFTITTAIPPGRTICRNCASKYTPRRPRQPKPQHAKLIAERNAKILAALLSGMFDYEVAATLRLGVRTVVRYVDQAQAATGARTRLQWGYLLGRADERQEEAWTRQIGRGRHPRAPQFGAESRHMSYRPVMVEVQTANTIRLAARAARVHESVIVANALSELLRAVDDGSPPDLWEPVEVYGGLRRRHRHRALHPEDAALAGHEPAAGRAVVQTPVQRGWRRRRRPQPRPEAPPDQRLAVLARHRDR